MNKARHKRSKMGCLPGDLPKSKKIRMLEGEDTPLPKLIEKTFKKKRTESSGTIPIRKLRINHERNSSNSRLSKEE